MGALVSALAFPVPNRSYSEPLLKRQGDRLVWLTTKSRARIKVPALYIRYHRDQRPANFTILYSHGNAEDVGINIPYLEQLSATLQADVMAYEYPGYSIAEGDEPSEELCYHAIRAAYDYLVLTRKVDPTTIVLLGRSLGTGPTVELASQVTDIAGTILQSPLESGIRCVLGTCGSIVLNPIDIFKSYAKVEQITGPVFIMHGEEDRVVPCRNGMALAELLEQRPHHAQVAYEPVWIPSRGHNDMPAEYCMMLFQRFLYYLPFYQRKLREQIAARGPGGEERQPEESTNHEASPAASSSDDLPTTQSEEERRAEQERKQKEEQVFKPPTQVRALTPVPQETEFTNIMTDNNNKTEPLLQSSSRERARTPTMLV